MTCGGSHPFTFQLQQKARHYRAFCIIIVKTPGNGFEPLLEEPESSVLPLDDPGAQFDFST